MTLRVPVSTIPPPAPPPPPESYPLPPPPPPPTTRYSTEVTPAGAVQEVVPTVVNDSIVDVIIVEVEGVTDTVDVDVIDGDTLGVGEILNV
jgi:hypothetical protein